MTDHSDPVDPPWYRLAIPASITLAGLFLGVLCVVWAPTRPYWACNAIIAASLCDMIDGRVARLARAASNFGTQLDSLADIVSFGVAPALLVFLLGHTGEVAPFPLTLLPVFAYVGAAAFRLARFNTQADSKTPVYDNCGAPMPVAALLVVTAIMTSFELGWDILRDPRVVLPLMVGTSALMVSTIPFPAYKRFKSRARQVAFFGAIGGGVTTLLVGGPGGAILFGLLLLYVVLGVTKWAARPAAR